MPLPPTPTHLQGRLRLLLPPPAVDAVDGGDGVAEQRVEDGVGELHLDEELVAGIVHPAGLLLAQLLDEHAVHVVLALAHVPLVGGPGAAVGGQEPGHRPLHGRLQHVPRGGGARPPVVPLPLRTRLLPRRQRQLRVGLVPVDVLDDLARQVEQQPLEHASAPRLQRVVVAIVGVVVVEERVVGLDAVQRFAAASPVPEHAHGTGDDFVDL